MLNVAEREKLLPQEALKERTSFGKRNARKTIKEGFVPATLYSSSLKPFHFSINKKALEKIMKNPAFFGTPIEISLSTFGVSQMQGDIRIIPKSVDFHPVNDYPLHIDFFHIQEETATLLIPIEIIGIDRSSGLKKGGKLNIARYHVPLECNLKSIPEKIEINISSFGIGRSVFLSKINLPEGCKVVKDYLILSIIGRGKKEKEEETATPAQAASTPAVKQEAKK